VEKLPNITILIRDVEDIVEYSKCLLEIGAVFIAGKPPAGLFSRVTVSFKTPQEKTLIVPFEIVRISPQGFALQIEKGFKREIIEQFLKVATEEIYEEIDVEVDRQEEEVVEVVDDAGHADEAGAVKTLPVHEKKRIAMTGDKSARREMIRDNQKSVHIFVFRNPRITLEEIQEFSSFASVSGEALGYIASQMEWTKNPSVVFNLVKNPSTPLSTALSLMGRLAVKELRYLAKGERVRSQVFRAARKRLMDMGEM